MSENAWELNKKLIDGIYSQAKPLKELERKLITKREQVKEKSTGWTADDLRQVEETKYVDVGTAVSVARSAFESLLLEEIKKLPDPSPKREGFKDLLLAVRGIKVPS